MGKRVVVLLLLLVVRMVVGGVVTGKCRDGQTVRLEGEVERVFHKGSKYVIEVGGFWGGWEEYKEVNKGDRVVLVGRCERSVIDFLLGRIWLTEAEIEVVERGVEEESAWKKYVFWIKERTIGIYKRQLPAKEAGLVAGMMWGEKELLGSEFDERLKQVGVIHIVVASGYNIMILFAILTNTLTYYLKRRWAFWVGVMVSFWYVVLVGWEAPVVRAWLMGIGVVGASVVGRLRKGWWLWLVSGWAMLMVRPVWVQSVSWQLSMVAVGGLLIVEPKLNMWAWKNMWGMNRKLLLRSNLLAILSVQMVISPLLWWYFGRVAWRGVFLNLLILPLVPVVMGLAGLQAGMGLVWEPLGRVAAVLVYSLAHVVVWLVG